MEGVGSASNADRLQQLEDMLADADSELRAALAEKERLEISQEQTAEEKKTKSSVDSVLRAVGFEPEPTVIQRIDRSVSRLDKAAMEQAQHFKSLIDRVENLRDEINQINLEIYQLKESVEEASSSS